MYRNNNNITKLHGLRTDGARTSMSVRRPSAVRPLSVRRPSASVRCPSASVRCPSALSVRIVRPLSVRRPSASVRRPSAVRAHPSALSVRCPFRFFDLSVRRADGKRTDADGSGRNVAPPVGTGLKSKFIYCHSSFTTRSDPN